jgi:tetratricopeptide (TPR) repeat protein
MSADSPSSSSESEPISAAGSPSADGVAAETETPEFPRRKSRYRQAEGEAAAGSNDEQIVLLSSLLATLMEKKGTAEPPAKEAKIFRFKKPTPVKPPLPGEGSSATDTAPPAAAAEANVAAAKAAPAPKADKPLAEGSLNWRAPLEPDAPRRGPGLFYWALLLLAAGAAFVAGRWTTGKGLAAPGSELAGGSPAPRTLVWSGEDVTQLDQILEADQAGDLEKANQMAKALKAQAGPLPGLEAYLNRIVARKQKYADAQSSLSRLISPAMEAGQLALVDDALGFTYARERRFQLASDTFKDSTVAEPFAAESFRLWGESLRRQGHMQQAITAFHEALARYPIGPVEDMDIREYVAYKIRLSQIEGSLPVDAPSEATQLAATGNSAGYWFLSDAALALQQGNGGDGAAALQKAKDALPPLLFNKLLGDYYFRAFASVPQVAAFFPAPGADTLKAAMRPRDVYFIDP